MIYYYFEYLRRYADWLDRKPFRAKAIVWGTHLYSFILLVTASLFWFRDYPELFMIGYLSALPFLPFFYVAWKKLGGSKA